MGVLFQLRNDHIHKDLAYAAICNKHPLFIKAPDYVVGTDYDESFTFTHTGGPGDYVGLIYVEGVYINGLNRNRPFLAVTGDLISVQLRFRLV